MLSQYDILYDVKETFKNHERRFVKHANQRSDVDYQCHSEFFPYTPGLRHGPWIKDLDLMFVVQHLLRPFYCERFLYHVLENTPTDNATALYRQEGVRELVDKPDLARKIEDNLGAVVELYSKIQKRNNEKDQLQRDYECSLCGTWRGVLKKITPYNLRLLASYVQATKQLSAALSEAESRPLQRARAFLEEEVQNTDFFRNVEEVFTKSYFQNERISLDVTISNNGYEHAVVFRDANESVAKDVARAVSRVPARIWGWLHTFKLPSTIAMHATDYLAEHCQVSRPCSLVGPLEFYTSMARFYREMKEAGLPISFPTLLHKEERRMNLPDAHNPVLLFKVDKYGRIRRDITHKSVGNDFSYEPNNNMVIISGPNQAGKTVSLRTIGLLTILGLNGGPVAAGEGAVLSMIDGLYTRFGVEDNMLRGEGAWTHELVTYRDTIYANITPYSLALMDEPTTGTDTTGSRTLLERFLRRHHKLGTATFVTTHHHGIGDLVDNGILYCARTLCPEIVKDYETGGLRKTFRIIPGRSTTSLADEVAAQVGMAEDDLDRRILERVSSGELDPRLFRNGSVNK